MKQPRHHSIGQSPAEFLEILYRRHYQGALVRSGASVIMWVFALAAYLAGIIRTNHFTGISVSVLYLILINPPALLFLKRIRRIHLYRVASLLINFLEILGYTAIIYFLGGIEATFLTPIYAALVTYVGIVAPRSFPYIIAFLCSSAFSFVVAGEYFGLLPPQRVIPSFDPPAQTQLAYLSVGVGLLFVVAYISSMTASVLKDNRNELREKNLEMLDTTRTLQAELAERKRVEEALRESEERFRVLFDNAPIGYHEFDSEGHISRVNRTELEMLGYTPEEMIGQPVWKFIMEKESEETVKAKVRGDKEPAKSFERTYLRKDGTTIPVLIDELAIKDRRGHITGIRTTIQDITERKRVEEEKENLRAQFNHAQKMESVGRLAGGVAHDFNNMLSVIQGRTELALLDVDPEDPLHASLREISRAAKRSSNVIRQLLAFARKQTISPRVLNLNDTVEGMLKMLRRLIGEDIDLTWQPDTNLWQVNMDPAQIDQILANLCVNARDAIIGVGKVIIETRNAVLDEAFCAERAGCAPGEYVMLGVSDNGSGMDKEILDNAFEPFFTTKDVGKGTGLGLSTVYGIVSQNQGFINVSSEPGKGTRFKIYLPRHGGKAEEGIHAAETEVPRGRGETILMVEDEALVLDVGRQILERLGYVVLATVSPGEAMAWEYAGEIHLLIIDVVLPEMSGKDLTDELLRLRPDIKILFMSGYTADIIAPHGVLERDVQFVQKPFTPESLARSVRQVIDR